VESLLSLVRLINEEFTCGAEQREAFEKIKEYLMSPPMLRAPKAGNHSRCILLCKNKLLELFYNKKKMARSFQWHT
jgi:hypothetical protein